MLRRNRPSCPSSAKTIPSALDTMLNTEMRAQAWARAYPAAKDILAKHGYKIGRCIGTGEFAQVFLLDGEPDYILKITGDATEPGVWKNIHDLDIRSPGLPDVPCAFALDTGGYRPILFAIISQKLVPLESRERNWLNEKNVPDLVQAAGGVTHRMTRGEVGSYYPACKPLDGDPFVKCAYEHLVRSAQDVGITKAEIDGLVDAYSKLLRAGIEFHDVHGGNVMRDPELRGKRGALKFTDLGLAEANPTTIPLVNPRARSTGRARG